MQRVLLALVLWGAASAIGWAQESGQAPRQSSGQATPDFSGRWVLDKVDRPDAYGGGFGGPGTYGPPDTGRFGGRPRGDPEEGAERRRMMPPMERGAVVTIKQSETELVLTFGGHERVYPLVPSDPETDAESGPAEREPSESDEAAPDDLQVKIRTSWKGKSLVTEAEQSRDTEDGIVTFKSREVRTLSDDGETMTVETTLETPRGSHTVTQVFKRRG